MFAAAAAAGLAIVSGAVDTHDPQNTVRDNNGNDAALELGDVSIRCLLDSVNQISIWATRVLGLQMLRSIEQVLIPTSWHETFFL